MCGRERDAHNFCDQKLRVARKRSAAAPLLCATPMQDTLSAILIIVVIFIAIVGFGYQLLVPRERHVGFQRVDNRRW